MYNGIVVKIALASGRWRRKYACRVHASDHCGKTFWRRCRPHSGSGVSDFSAYCIGAQGGDVFYFLRIFCTARYNLGKFLHNCRVYDVFFGISFLRQRGRGRRGFRTSSAISRTMLRTLSFIRSFTGMTAQLCAQYPRVRCRWHSYIESDLDTYFVEKSKGIPRRGISLSRSIAARQMRSRSPLCWTASAGRWVKSGYRPACSGAHCAAMNGLNALFMISTGVAVAFLRAWRGCCTFRASVRLFVGTNRSTRAASMQAVRFGAIRRSRRLRRPRGRMHCSIVPCARACADRPVFCLP